MRYGGGVIRLIQCAVSLLTDDCWGDEVLRSFHRATPEVGIPNDWLALRRRWLKLGRQSSLMQRADNIFVTF